MTRLLDILISIVGLALTSPLLMAVIVLGWLDTGSPIFMQERVGRHKKPFTLIKFRTMRVGTASVASHLADANSVTPFGNFLRQSKLDELPQLINVVKGDMSLVGPRPGLPNQIELTHYRELHKVFDARPGITGLGQISGIDMSTPEKLATIDATMLANLNVKNYLGFIIKTAFGAGTGDALK